MAELPNPCLLEGAGNRILVWDARAGGRPPAFALPRRARPSYDQLVLLEGDGAGALHARIRNADGSEAEQCGNGMRCLGCFLDRRGAWPPGEPLRVRLPTGEVILERDGQGGYRAALPKPRFGRAAAGYRGPWLTAPNPPPIEAGYLPLPDGTGLGREAVIFDLVALGNPHAIVWVEADPAGLDLACLARTIDNREHFPAGVNLSLARIEAPDRVRARVHERGVGETASCGSAACAIVAAGRLGRRLGSRVWVAFPGGTLEVQWAGPGHPMWLGGPVRVLGAMEPRHD